jgi:hypothetical protein
MQGTNLLCGGRMRYTRGVVQLAVTCSLAIGACGSSRPLVAEGGAPSDADVNARAEVEAGDAPEAVGYCSSGDRICNDDPTQSALAGVCTVFGDPPIGWGCVCNPGFSLTPPTPRGQLCRAGTTCIAAAADAWAIKRPLDHFDCEARTILECQGASEGVGKQTVSADLTALIRSCYEPYGVWIRIEFAAGCPSLLELSNDLDLDKQIADCLVAALAAKRWRCAEDPNACELYEYDTLLP